MPIRLLALDIDGTLVNSSHVITPATLAALHEVRDSGVRIALVTGRRYRRALPMADQLGIDAPIVTASGALIKHPADNHRTLHMADLPRSVLLRMLSVVCDQGFEAVVYADTYHEGFDFYCLRRDPPQSELAEYLRLNAGSERLCPDLMTAPPVGIFAGFAMGKRDEMLALSDELQAQTPGTLYTHVLRSPMYSGFMCEIAPAGATKWSGVRKLADQWGIADEEICAVGDDVNDIPMVEGAGVGIAMGNAVDELKAVACHVAPANDDDGLAEVARWILRGELPRG